ncbi:MAG TPA: TolC family protein [Geobacteraceae bacterium]
MFLRVITASFLLFFSVSPCLRGGFFDVSTAQAAEPRILSLEQALELADDRNRDILKAREFFRQVEGKYVEERSAALPQLTLNAFLSRQQDDSQKALLGGLFPTRQDSRNAEIDVTQVLYTWGKVGAAIRAAEKGYRTADERLRTSRQDTRRDVTTAFYDVLLAREQRAIALQNLEQKQRHLDETERRYAAGVATDYDVLAARVAKENARPETIRTENQLRSSRDRLRYLLAVEEDVDVAGTLDSAAATLPSYDEALAVARKRRPELAELHWQKEIYQELVTIDNAGDKPRLDLKGGYGWRQLEVGDQHGDGMAWNVGVYLTFPFFDGLKTRGKVAQTESQRRTLEIDEARLSEEISLEIRDALNGVRESHEIVTALGGTVAQAERLLAMAEQGYELGVKIRLEVEDAELNLLQARGNLARARRDYLVARVNLARVMGVLGEGAGT